MHERFPIFISARRMTNGDVIFSRVCICFHYARLLIILCLTFDEWWIRCRDFMLILAECVLKPFLFRLDRFIRNSMCTRQLLIASNVFLSLGLMAENPPMSMVISAMEMSGKKQRDVPIRFAFNCLDGAFWLL